MAASIKNIIEKPLGWELEELGYSHNVWLDVVRVSGVIPFVLLVIFSVRSIWKVKKAIFIDSKQLSTNILFFTYLMAFFLVFMVEPIIDGLFALFSLYCLFTGIVTKYIENFMLVAETKDAERYIDWSTIDEEK